MLGCMLVTESAASVYASGGSSGGHFDDDGLIRKSSSKAKYGKDDPFRVYVAGSTALDISTPIFLRHTVDSDGVSKGGISKKDYKMHIYDYPEDYHTIKITIHGLNTKINTKDFSTISETSDSVTISEDAETLSYDIRSTCFSLIGYEETHTFRGRSTERTKAKKKEIVSVNCTCKYGV